MEVVSRYIHTRITFEFAARVYGGRGKVNPPRLPFFRRPGIRLINRRHLRSWEFEGLRIIVLLLYNF